MGIFLGFRALFWVDRAAATASAPGLGFSTTLPALFPILR